MKKTRWREDNHRLVEPHLQDNDAIIYDIGAGQKPIHFRGKYVNVDWQPPADIICNLIEPWPIQNGVADIVLMTNFLEHIPEPFFIIREASRILKKGGKIVGTVPFVRDLHQMPHDYLRYTESMLKYLLKDFSQIEVMPMGNGMKIANEIYWSKENGIIKKIFLRLNKFMNNNSRPDFPEGYFFSAIK